MSVITNKRSFSKIIWGIWIRSLSILIPFTFPAYITTFLHRLRGVKIGKGSKVNRTAFIDDAFPGLVEIGANVWVTARVMILCHQRDINYHEIGSPVINCPIKREKVIIKDGAHIGFGAILMPGVSIGEGAVIGAGAVVTSNIPDYSIAVGVPAKVIREIEK